MIEQIFLVGNPNVGKSSVFNQLTGVRQKTANYPGVTVERKLGNFQNHPIIDLPGLKSVWSESVDEQVSVQELLKLNADKGRVLFIADGMNLEQDLFLFSQVADLQIPLILLINFKDEVEKQALQIDVAKLSQQLGCKVFLFSAKTGDGLAELEAMIKGDQFTKPNTFIRTQYDVANKQGIFNNTLKKSIEDFHQQNHSKEQLEMVQNDFSSRQSLVNRIVDTAIVKKHIEDFRTDKIDAIALHPIWGSIIFFLLLLFIFQSIFSFSSIPMDMIDGFFGDASVWAQKTLQPAWLADLVGNAILPGLGGILIFIPQIVILFFLLGILESTGYMSRISYLSDKWLKGFGLSGSSVIPLMSGIACAIPAVMSARSIVDERERLAAIMVTPFMTCSARLPVYTVLIGLIFPEDAYVWIFNAKGLMLFGLYLLGTLTSLVAAWLFTRWKKSNFKNLWVLDLPRYRMPHWKNIFIDTLNKTKAFVFGAGKIILIFSLILWFISTNSPKSEQFFEEQISNITPNDFNQDEASIRLEYSYAGYMGKAIEPLIKPLGYDWKIGIALISSFAAREVFVGTISTVYSIGSEDEMTVIERLQAERNPLTGGLRFDWATCISLLLFYAFAMQCMSTVAIVKKETGTWKWALIQLFGMLLLAYVSAFIAYQLLS